MTSPPVRAVVCDFGGVLTTPLVEGFRGWERASGVSLTSLGQAMAEAEQIHGSNPLHDVEKGLITFTDFLGRIEAELGSSLDTLLDNYFEHLDPNVAMIEHVAGLRRRGLRTAMLTNNIREWQPRWQAMVPGLHDIFELIVDSAFVGLRKPEPEIYQLTIERLGDGIEPAECVLIDDIEVNCAGAEAVGMKAVHFVETDQAIADLEAVLGRGR